LVVHIQPLLMLCFFVLLQLLSENRVLL